MKRLIGIGTAVLLVAGCSAASNPALEQAKADFAQIQGNPQISAKAPVAVHEASQALNRAERAWDHDKNDAEVNHLAYLAQQRSAIARNVAQEKIAQETAARLAEERHQILLQSSRREAEQAKQQAEASAQQAEQARQLAQSRALEAQRARLRQRSQAEQLEQQQQAEASSKKIQQLENQLAEFKARETNRGLELTLSGVLFGFDQANLKPGALRDLSPLVAFLKSNPDRRITLEGYTDNIGSSEYNRNLSQERADSVKNYLVQNGIDPDRISAQGLGEEYPVASNNTEAGRLQNRRVEIIIAQQPGQTSQRNNQASSRQ